MHTGAQSHGNAVWFSPSPEPPALAGLTSLVGAANVRVRAVVVGTYVDPCRAQRRGPPSSPLQVTSRAGC